MAENMVRMVVRENGMIFQDPEMIEMNDALSVIQEATYRPSAFDVWTYGLVTYVRPHDGDTTWEYTFPEEDGENECPVTK